MEVPDVLELEDLLLLFVRSVRELPDIARRHTQERG